MRKLPFGVISVLILTLSWAQVSAQAKKPKPAPATAKKTAAAPSSVSDYKGWVASVGVGYGIYNSSWEHSVLDNWIRHYYHVWHYFPRMSFSGSLERRSLFKLGPISMNVKAEAVAGFLGGSRIDLEPSDFTISTGGLTLGAAVMAKFAYPLTMKGGALIAPYIGTGFQYLMLSSNGSGNEWTGDEGYSAGWTEHLFTAPICIGFEYQVKKLVFSAEYRHSVIYSGITDFEPDGYWAYFYSVQSGFFFSVALGYRF